MATDGITIVALVVTLIVLLILAGITIVYVFGDNSVFKQASEAKLKTDIADWQERLEISKNSVFIEGLGTFNLDYYFDYIQQQGIINNRNTDVINNGDGTYDVTTKPGYVFLVTLIPTPENPTDAEIEYIGQAGKIAPIIKKLEVNATSSSITGKAVVARLGNGTVEYFYKLSIENDGEYKKMNFISDEEGATANITPVEGTTYVVKVVAKNEAGENELTEEITIGVKVKSITLDKTQAIVAPSGRLQLVPTILPENAENKKLTWSSSKPEIATVDENGIVVGIALGDAVVTATTTDGSNLSTKCNITVKIPVTGISLDKTSAKVEIGKKVTLIATVLPENATNKNLTWSSSNTNVATVSNTGIVTGVANGTATITATSSDNKTIKKTCSVQVTEESNWEELAKIAKTISKSGISSETKTATGTTDDGIDYSITVGDIFKVKYGTEVVRVRVLGFNHDDLVNKSAYAGQTSTKAGISFEFLDYMTGVDKWKMNDYSNTNSGGWTRTTIREKLESNKGKLSNASYIKQVKKPYATKYDSDSLSTYPSNDYLWLLSAGEILGNIREFDSGSGWCLTLEGVQYKFYKDCQLSLLRENPALRKGRAGFGGESWWLRSPAMNNAGFPERDFCCISSNGQPFFSSSNAEYGVAPGFCI
ncbi:MAG: Ig domain-containing protein [Clostridia bacterium]|nr:Ig domain-containing protein [Clostridia bacterium]